MEWQLFITVKGAENGEKFLDGILLLLFLEAKAGGIKLLPSPFSIPPVGRCGVKVVLVLTIISRVGGGGDRKEKFLTKQCSSGKRIKTFQFDRFIDIVLPDQFLSLFYP